MSNIGSKIPPAQRHRARSRVSTPRAPRRQYTQENRDAYLAAHVDEVAAEYAAAKYARELNKIRRVAFAAGAAA